MLENREREREASLFYKNLNYFRSHTQLSLPSPFNPSKDKEKKNSSPPSPSLSISWNGKAVYGLFISFTPSSTWVDQVARKLKLTLCLQGTVVVEMYMINDFSANESWVSHRKKKKKRMACIGSNGAFPPDNELSWPLIFEKRTPEVSSKENINMSLIHALVLLKIPKLWYCE